MRLMMVEGGGGDDKPATTLTPAWDQWFFSDKTTAKVKKKQSYDDKKNKVLNRAISVIGEDEARRIKAIFDHLIDQKAKEEAEGIIMGLLARNVPMLVVMNLLYVGKYQCDRLKKAKRIEKKRKYVWHELTNTNIDDFVKISKQTWSLEDGFPCAHRRPHQYFTESGVKWTECWKQYKEYRDKRVLRVMSYERYLQYKDFHFPFVRLTR